VHGEQQRGSGDDHCKQYLVVAAQVHARHDRTGDARSALTVGAASTSALICSQLRFELLESRIHRPLLLTVMLSEKHILHDCASSTIAGARATRSHAKTPHFIANSIGYAFSTAPGAAECGMHYRLHGAGSALQARLQRRKVNDNFAGNRTFPAPRQER
jgi:hypothetical protein